MFLTFKLKYLDLWWFKTEKLFFIQLLFDDWLEKVPKKSRIIHLDLNNITGLFELLVVAC